MHQAVQGKVVEMAGRTCPILSVAQRPTVSIQADAKVVPVVIAGIQINWIAVKVPSFLVKRGVQVLHSDRSRLGQP